MSKELYTGPDARQMLNSKNGDEPKQKWKVFLLLEQRKQGLVLKNDSEFLYQVYARLL